MDREDLLKAMTDAFIAKRHGEDFEKAKQYEPQHAAAMRDDAKRTMVAVLEAIERVAIISEKPSTAQLQAAEPRQSESAP
jgi:hypothetical protein